MSLRWGFKSDVSSVAGMLREGWAANKVWWNPGEPLGMKGWWCWKLARPRVREPGWISGQRKGKKQTIACRDEAHQCGPEHAQGLDSRESEVRA